MLEESEKEGVLVYWKTTHLLYSLRARKSLLLQTFKKKEEKHATTKDLDLVMFEDELKTLEKEISQVTAAVQKCQEILAALLKNTKRVAAELGVKLFLNRRLTVEVLCEDVDKIHEIYDSVEDKLVLYLGVYKLRHRLSCRYDELLKQFLPLEEVKVVMAQKYRVTTSLNRCDSMLDNMLPGYYQKGFKKKISKQSTSEICVKVHRIYELLKPKI